MGFINSRLYLIFDRIADFLILNIIWILMSLPLITLFPATAAMFGVVREWSNGRNPSIIRDYFTFFKQNFKNSFIIGLLWITVGFFCYINFASIIDPKNNFNVLMISSIFLVSILFLMTTIYIFPVMVNFHAKWTEVIKNSLLLSVSQLGTTILCVIILLLAYIISYIIPITFLIVWSVSSFMIYSLCNKKFKVIISIKDEDTLNEI